MRIAIAHLNYHTGNFEGNLQKMIDAMRRYFLLIIIPVSLCNACRDECDDIRTEQLLRFGTYQLNIDSPGDTLTVGDSIRFSMQLPTSLFDSISLREIDIEAPEIGFYVTRDTEAPKDTPLIYVFDQFFDISIHQGEMLSPYHFRLEERNSEFGLDFYYICKKKLDYYIPIRFERITARGVNTRCMMGDTDTWDAGIEIDSEYNTIDNWPDYFGFVVK